jgi:hypothetical protein
MAMMPSAVVSVFPSGRVRVRSRISAPVAFSISMMGCSGFCWMAGEKEKANE